MEGITTTNHMRWQETQNPLNMELNWDCLNSMLNLDPITAHDKKRPFRFIYLLVKSL